MSPTSTYILVDSLYGPGTVITWLLTMISVLIDWTLNKSMRHDDIVNFNLIASFILPIVSTGHLTYQITRYPAPVPQIITSISFDDRAMVAALEAPLNICETFPWCSLILVLPCMSWRSGLARKSCFWMVTNVGLLSWTTETILNSRTTAKGIKIQDTTLSRPYVFLFTLIIVASWTFIIGCFVIVGGSKAIHILRKCLLPARGSHVRSSENAVPMVSIGVVTGVYMPVSFIVFFYAMAAQGEDFWSTAKHLGVFFFPKSQESLASLDQAVALGTGIATILYLVKSMYESQRGDNSAASSLSDMDKCRRWPSHSLGRVPWNGIIACVHWMIEVIGSLQGAGEGEFRWGSMCRLLHMQGYARLSSVEVVLIFSKIRVSLRRYQSCFSSVLTSPLLNSMYISTLTRIFIHDIAKTLLTIPPHLHHILQIFQLRRSYKIVIHTRRIRRIAIFPTH
jgi:hypothetical protein